jgi:hypothetical protein
MSFFLTVSVLLHSLRGQYLSTWVAYFARSKAYFACSLLSLEMSFLSTKSLSMAAITCLPVKPKNYLLKK